MNYDQRINQIRSWFKEQVVIRFSAPTGIDPQAAMDDICEAINASLPAKLDHNQLTTILAKVQTEVAREASSRTLPAPKLFIKAAVKTAKPIAQATTHIGYLKGKDADTYEMQRAAEKMQAGEPISDYWLRPSSLDKLIENTDISKADINKYLAPDQRI